MLKTFMRASRRAITSLLVLAAVALIAGGCVAAVGPGYDPYGYGYEPAPMYGPAPVYAPGVVVAPPPVVIGGWHGGWHHHGDGAWHWHAEHHDGHRG